MQFTLLQNYSHIITWLTACSKTSLVSIEYFVRFHVFASKLYIVGKQMMELLIITKPLLTGCLKQLRKAEFFIHTDSLSLLICLCMNVLHSIRSWISRKYSKLSTWESGREIILETSGFGMWGRHRKDRWQGSLHDIEERKIFIKFTKITSLILLARTQGW